MTSRRTRRTSRIRAVAGLCFLVLTTACDVTGPGPSCIAPGTFTVLPVPISAIASSTVIGGLGPPSHTIPTDHAGVYLTGTGIALSAPANMDVKQLQRRTYTASPFRQGQSDYSITANPCGGTSVLFGHVQSLSSAFGSAVFGNCLTYNTASETIQTCDAAVNISVAAGELLGTVGGPSAGAFDFGVYDANTQNYFVKASRYSSLTRTAICPYDPFTPALRTQLINLIAIGAEALSGEEPACGAMSVDVANSAQGAWVTQSNPVNQAGDESWFMVLAPHPLYPVSGQTFSAGPAAVRPTTSATIVKFPVTTTGRVNRRFRDVTADGLVYCYVAVQATSLHSYFVRLTPANVLNVELKTHAAGSSPCAANPSTWTQSTSAIAFIR